MKTLAILSAAAIACSAAAFPAAAQDPIGQGSVVRGSDGVELGRLEGRRGSGDDMRVVVRGSDGRLRAVPAAGTSIHGGELHVAWSMSQFERAETMTVMPGAPATGAGGNQGPSPTDDGAYQAPRDPAVEANRDATRPATPQQQQAPDPTRQDPAAPR